MIDMQISRQRDRPSLDDQLEKSGLLCGRDAMAGGTVLGLQVGAGSKDAPSQKSVGRLEFTEFDKTN